jgi:hypothetical protein
MLTGSRKSMPDKTAPSPTAQLPVPVELIERRICLIRAQKVMLSPVLAELYQVETRALVQAVKRNLDRFPEDFMFQLTPQEYENLKSQFVISSWGGARRATPYAFIKLRDMLATHKDLAIRMEKLEATQKDHASVITILAEEIDDLKRFPEPPPKRPSDSATACKKINRLATPASLPRLVQPGHCGILDPTCVKRSSSPVPVPRWPSRSAARLTRPARTIWRRIASRTCSGRRRG